MRSSGTTCRASPSTAMRSFPPEPKRRGAGEGDTKQKFDTTLCMLGLQCAGSNERKPKENKCRCIVQRTRVQRVPCFLIYNAFTQKLHKESITGLTFFRHVNQVCSTPSCHPQPHTKYAFSGPSIVVLYTVYVRLFFFFLQFVNVPVSYVICIYV